MTTDFRALCAELLDELEYQTDWSTAESLKAKARAALADEPAVPDGREPASVTGQPRPVPVSERLPGPGDRNTEGKCWWFCTAYPGEWPHWILGNEAFCDPTHWLPAHALPIPQQQENTNG